ncbi:hypothetical protein SAMN05444338_10747 [Flavobacterium degerlachei]|jgi:hypothetical protein|uniref:Uncharacterized protein n=1 Tax=Flavobacterium degerlachei TaxID=229203 RepID=A0A1H2Z0F2_9FLAO|nr:hypothetical protein SAMN05444338_10747 [Flavobacterium degerlachei]
MNQKIKNTKAFQALTPMQQGVYKRSRPMQEMTDQYRMATNTTTEQWLNDHKPNGVFKSIILELIEDAR